MNEDLVKDVSNANTQDYEKRIVESNEALSKYAKFIASMLEKYKALIYTNEK